MNFVELREGEVRRILSTRSSQNTYSRHFGEYGQEEGPEPLVGPRPFLRSWINSCRSYGGLTAEGRREIAILMSFPPPLILGSIVADRKPVAPACAIGSYATA
jgi:hypothetical protein